MSQSVVIDLKVDTSLMNPHFESYRVSIDPMVTFCQPLDSCVNECRLSDDEYSYLHLSMASHYNHLFNDPYCPHSVFLATSDGQIVCVSVDMLSGKPLPPKVVYLVRDIESALISVSFPNHCLALISISRPTTPEIYVVSTPSRSAAEPWLVLSTIDLTAYDFQTQFHLSCSQSLDLPNNCSQIELILWSVDKKQQNIEDLNEILPQNSTKDLNKSSFNSVLNWFTVTGSVDECNEWKVKRHRRMHGSHWPKYVAFDYIGSPFLCLVSDKDFAFVYDSDKPIVENDLTLKSIAEPKLLYTYSQTLEDICVTFKLPVHITKSDIQIDLKPTTIDIKIKDIIEFGGELCHMIDSNSSVWTLQSQQDFQLLEITVNKTDNGMVWKQFITGDTNGTEIVSNEMIEEMQQKLTHLTNEMPDIETDNYNNAYDPLGREECDFTDDSLVFNRYNANTHLISHRIDLSGSHWLFTIPVQKSMNSDCHELPHFVVRHDVDALVWAPHSSSDINEFDAKHMATFAAFGYVQASKTNTRFIAAPNDFNYVAIADGARHVYVYRQPIGIVSGELRNRKTGKEVQTIATQHVVNLNDCHSILGIHAIHDSIFVLSNDKIFLIKL